MQELRTEVGILVLAWAPATCHPPCGCPRRLGDYSWACPAPSQQACGFICLEALPKLLFSLHYHPGVSLRVFVSYLVRQMGKAGGTGSAGKLKSPRV